MTKFLLTRGFLKWVYIQIMWMAFIVVAFLLCIPFFVAYFIDVEVFEPAKGGKCFVGKMGLNFFDWFYLTATKLDPKGVNRATLFELAEESPEKLCEWIDNDVLPHTMLTFAAEALGLVGVSQLAIPRIIKLLSHPKSIVREGALYGADAYLEDPQVKAKVQEMSTEDPSSGIREVAMDILNDE